MAMLFVGTDPPNILWDRIEEICFVGDLHNSSRGKWTALLSRKPHGVDMPQSKHAILSGTGYYMGRPTVVDTIMI